MSDRDVTLLLDRLAAGSPAMDVSLPEVVGTGRRRVRRRRAASSGMTLASVLLLVTVWVGLGQGGGGLLGTQQVVPAGSWEVVEPSPVELPEGLRQVGDMQPLTLSRGPSSSAATFIVDGSEETAEGRSLGEGVEVYAGERGTVVVWEAGVEGEVWPEPQGSGGWTDVTVAGERLRLWMTDVAGYRPRDVLLHDGEDLRTATGASVSTGRMRDGRVEVTAFEVPELGLSGYLDGTALHEVDTLTVAGVDRPWWRGGGSELITVARLPREAVLAREVLRDVPAGEPVEVSETRPTVLVGSSSMVLFVSDRAPGGRESVGLVDDIEWSTDGQTWHAQPTDLGGGRPDATPDGAGDRFGPGDEVSILGETYRVATDVHGWPRLVAEDGSDFLAVSDEVGPSAGGSVIWRESWWPWSGRNRVDFTVGATGSITLTGPSGDVGLEVVPARRDGAADEEG